MNVTLFLSNHRTEEGRKQTPCRKETGFWDTLPVRVALPLVPVERGHWPLEGLLGWAGGGDAGRLRASGAASSPWCLIVRMCLFAGGRDKRGGPILTFPARSNHDRIRQEDLRRLISYLACIPR